MSKFKHIFWPLYNDSSLYDATELEILAEEMRAAKFLHDEFPSGNAQWRSEPEWCCERQYDTQRERRWLTFRAYGPVEEAAQ